MSPSERERSVGAVGKIADVAEPLEETADVVDALGIIINRPLQMRLSEVFDQLKIETADQLLAQKQEMHREMFTNM